MLEGQTGETLGIDSLKAEDAGLYQVRATNSINDSITRTALGGSCNVQMSNNANEKNR